MPCSHSETVIMPYWHSQSPFHIVPVCTWSSVRPVGICPRISVCPVGIPVHPIFFNGHNLQPFISNEHLPCSHTTTNPHRPPPPTHPRPNAFHITICLCPVDTHKLLLFNEHLPYLHIALWTFPIGVYALWALPIPPIHIVSYMPVVFSMRCGHNTINTYTTCGHSHCDMWAFPTFIFRKDFPGICPVGIPSWCLNGLWALPIVTFPYCVPLLPYTLWSSVCPWTYLHGPACALWAFPLCPIGITSKCMCLVGTPNPHISILCPITPIYSMDISMPLPLHQWSPMCPVGNSNMPCGHS